MLWAAFVLGLAGSLHCAVMCGPLMLAVTRARPGGGFCVSPVLYHAGRLTTYATLGALFGVVGRTFALVGLQRWLSLITGLAILVGLLAVSRASLNAPVARLVLKLKSLFGPLLRRRTVGSQFLLGALNGLLPCGLVYVAAAGATAASGPAGGALHMAAFGLGTLPVLLGVGALGGKLRALATRAPKLVPISAAVVAALLIVRGLALDIPYLSPALASGSTHRCH